MASEVSGYILILPARLAQVLCPRGGLSHLLLWTREAGFVLSQTVLCWCSALWTSVFLTCCVDKEKVSICYFCRQEENNPFTLCGNWKYSAL